MRLLWITILAIVGLFKRRSWQVAAKRWKLVHSSQTTYAFGARPTMIQAARLIWAFHYLDVVMRRP